jgi:phosphate transport system permease protein
MINTVVVTIICLIISIPFGIFTAIYLVEYTHNSRIVSIIRACVQTLAGIPSIVYGLFGLIFFVNTLGWGYSILAGSFTLAIMVLPVIIRSTEEGLLSVPISYREGSFALGAGKIRTIFIVVLPAAFGSIMAGIILSIGRIVGESAALIFTAGTVAKTATSLFQSGRTLSVHMYALSSEGLHMQEASATAVILLLMASIINILSRYMLRRAANRV